MQLFRKPEAVVDRMQATVHGKPTIFTKETWAFIDRTADKCLRCSSSGVVGQEDTRLRRKTSASARCLRQAWLQGGFGPSLAISAATRGSRDSGSSVLANNFRTKP